MTMTLGQFKREVAAIPGGDNTEIWADCGAMGEFPVEEIDPIITEHNGQPTIFIDVNVDYVG